MKFIRKIKLLSRIWMVALLALVIAVVPSYLYLREANKAIQSTALERAGFLMIRELTHFSKELQRHRGVATGWLNGKVSQSDFEAAAKGVDTELAHLIESSTRGTAPAELKIVVTKLDEGWKSLKSALVAKSLSVEESRKRYNALIDIVSVNTETMSDVFGLSLDPEAATYHLIMGSIFYMQGLIEALSVLRAKGADALAEGGAGKDDNVGMAVLAGKALYFDKRAHESYHKAREAESTVDASIKSIQAEAAKSSAQALDFVQKLAGGRDIRVTEKEFRAQMNAVIQAQERLSDDALTELDRLLTARESKLRREMYVMLLAVGTLFVLMMMLCLLIARSVAKPLAHALAVANAVAGGKLDNHIDDAARDETGQLLAAMARMQGTIKDFVAAQGEMKQRHDDGVISHRIDASRFAGSYAEMAQMTNELVAAHIAVNARIVEVVGRYAQGDLSADMDKLPGEKGKITEAVDGVKASLGAVNAEIGTLVQAAAQGDFSVRGDEAKFDHDFREMVAGLNQLMHTADQGLSEVSRVLSALAKGDLTETVSNHYAGTFGKLKDDANQTVENLTTIVNQIKEASETIDTASKEITQGNTDLSQRTEEQASSLEETASSMEELTSTVKQNAENARQANQLAVGASDVAVKGGDVVKQVVTTMSGISESSKKIADIIGTIDGIAFQTNILALNAAVEAARAGEQGRGFAVVASEVRNLAQRSANAAKEIKELITDSVGKVDAGTQLVDEAGKTMEDIVTSVKRVTDIMAEITAASQEQSSGIEQVNQAITQMDEVTQQNAALVEEAAAAAESMQEQAGTLVQTVAQFRLANQGAAIERRSANRATNVARIPAKPVAKAETKSIDKRAPQRAVGAEDFQEF